MLGGLSDKLRSSIDKLTRSSADREAVNALVKDIQRALISADVDVRLVQELSESVRERAFEKPPAGMSRKEHVVKVVYEELTKIMGEKAPEIELKPKRVLLVGLFGSGKTTTASKLARFYQKRGLKPALVACDTVRPAAFEQLQQLAERIDVPFYGERGESDSSKIAKNALRLEADVLIFDSSGRSALDDELTKEIKRLNDAVDADERILVIPADIGQAAKEQASAFHKTLGITNVIVTKMDATAKGGGALTACNETGAKVLFLAVGETPEDLQPYRPEKFVARLIGFPDLETLLEKARSVVDEKSAERVVKGDFDLEDFYQQIESMGQMGPLSQVMDMAGLGKIAKKQNLDVQQEKMERWGHALKSMTPEERANPDVIDAPRIHRIAEGSGVRESEVREFLANYRKTKKMMKKINPKKLKRGGMGSLFRQFGMG